MAFERCKRELMLRFPVIVHKPIGNLQHQQYRKDVNKNESISCLQMKGGGASGYSGSVSNIIYVFIPISKYIKTVLEMVGKGNFDNSLKLLILNAANRGSLVLYGQSFNSQWWRQRRQVREREGGDVGGEGGGGTGGGGERQRR